MKFSTPHRANLENSLNGKTRKVNIGDMHRADPISLIENWQSSLQQIGNKNKIATYRRVSAKTEMV